MTVYCFDIDGTICTNTDGDYAAAQPFEMAIDRVNKLYNEGHQIVFYTARGYTTGIDWHEFTAKQLSNWNVNYHGLVMGKPYADIYIDDKAVNSADWEKDSFKMPYEQVPSKEK